MTQPLWAPAAASPAALPLTVRPATRADHAAIERLLADLELGWAARDLASFVVGERAGEVVGCAELRDVGGARLLSCVGVRADLHGTGLGRVLVEGALAGVAEDVYLYTVIPGFFAKLGFRDAGAPPSAVPSRRIYDCTGCDAARCRCMVRTRTDAALRSEPLRAGHLSTLERAFAGSGEPTCDLSAASLWIWRDCDAPTMAWRDGHVCVRLAARHEAPYFLEPVGTGDPLAALDACLADTGRVSRVRRAFVDRLPAARYDVVPLRDHFDYVCDAREIAELRGSHHEPRRNRVRKFAREHPRHELRRLAATDGAAALALFDRWASEAGIETPGTPSRECQRRALERAFEDFDRLRLTGGALVDDGALVGFTLASRGADTAIVHFQHADAALAGVYQALLVETCRTVLADVRWIDLEEDLGLPGLRRMKLAWQPARLVEKFAVTRR